MNEHNMSDEYLNSFVDNQLDSSERIRAFEAIRQNDQLKEQVCELRCLKEIVQQAYNHPPNYKQLPVRKQRVWVRNFQALAACLLLLLGGVSGWLTHAWTNTGNSNETLDMAQVTQRNENLSDYRKVIVHVSNANPIKLKAALDETESLLDKYKRDNRQVQVELIANKRGVDLLRSDVSTYSKRIGSMQHKYPNLSFLVCGQTISKLQNEGKVIQLLPHTTIATSAADQINKRLQQGWGYVRI